MSQIAITSSLTIKQASEILAHDPSKRAEVEAVLKARIAKAAPDCGKARRAQAFLASLAQGYVPSYASVFQACARPKAEQPKAAPKAAALTRTTETPVEAPKGRDSLRKLEARMDARLTRIESAVGTLAEVVTRLANRA